MDKYFIGLSPNIELFNLVQERKDRIAKLVGMQKFLSDEPHTTLTVFTTNNLEAIKKSLDNLCENISEVNVRLSENSLDVFYNDCLTDNHTPTYSLRGSYVQLADIQKRVIVTIKPHNTLQAFNSENPSLKKEEQRNVQMYGFPFVGQNWKPHITLASVEPDKFRKVFDLIKTMPIKGKFKLDALALYQIQDPLKKIKSWKLK
ncbi:MAG: 2'-5' RNA ligase family protein [archaeon]|nr:2'-5' RNA ligase family protein [archaeon]